MTNPITVDALWRYPVKSMRGEELSSARIEPDGLPGDRVVHVRDTGTDRVVTSRAKPGLLALQGGLDAAGRPTVEGQPWDSDQVAALVRAAAGPTARLAAFDGPDIGQRYDVLPLTVLTTGMVAELGYDFRRFRPNLLLDGVTGLDERDWVGRGLRVGDALIGVRKRRQRCVMTTFDPDTIEQDADVLRRIQREFDGLVALDCWVIEPGEVSLGQPVELVDLPPGLVWPEGNAAMQRRARRARAAT
jgi:uncharacterized protein